jgi:hypothetical protein
MIEGDRFRMIAKDTKKQMNYEIIKKGVTNFETNRKGYMTKDEDGNPRFFSYAQFHMLASHDTIELITKDGKEV